MRDITLGQYFPGNSPIHRLDPRTKLLGMLYYRNFLREEDYRISVAGIVCCYGDIPCARPAFLFGALAETHPFFARFHVFHQLVYGEDR